MQVIGPWNWGQGQMTCKTKTSELKASGHKVCNIMVLLLN